MIYKGFPKNMGDLYQEHIKALYASVSIHIVFFL